MNISALFAFRPIAFYPQLRQVTGSIPAAIMLQQLLYWWERRTEETIYKTEAEMQAETSLTPAEQKSAIKALKERGFVTVERKGLPAKRHFVVHVEAINDALIALTRSAKSAELYRRNPPNCIGEIRRTNTENTTETTTETTSGASSADALSRRSGGEEAGSSFMFHGDPMTDVSDENGGARKQRRKKRTPVTFRKSEYGGRVPPEWLKWAQEHGLSEREAAIEADRFAIYWNEGKGKNTRRSDWMATWRNWVAKHGSYTPEHLKTSSLPKEAASDDEWRVRIAMMKRLYGNENVALKRWPKDWGAKPGEEGCKCPEVIWREVWRQ